MIKTLLVLAFAVASCDAQTCAMSTCEQCMHCEHPIDQDDDQEDRGCTCKAAGACGGCNLCTTCGYVPPAQPTPAPGPAAPTLPDVYGFVQQFNVSGAMHHQKVYLDKPNQFERLDGNAGPGTIQLNRPKAQGCTYSVNGVGTSWVGCSDWAATSVVGDPINTKEMTPCGPDTIDGVVCDKFCGQGGYSCTAWFKKGTNELVQTQSADDEKAGTDKGLKRYSSWMNSLPAGTFDVDPAWKCQGPAQCSAAPGVALRGTTQLE